jgi:hypothetical protein
MRRSTAIGGQKVAGDALFGLVLDQSLAEILLVVLVPVRSVLLRGLGIAGENVDEDDEH